ncbi:MAG: crossover junction endodeoxyribonuclease RuvC [Armatimonas sp.]
MIVLGFDPGTATTGFGVVRYEGGKLTPIDYGVLLTRPETPMSERLLSIRTDVVTLLDQYNPDAISMERLFFDRNVTNGLVVGRAIGVIQVTVAERALPWFEYTPMQVKTSVTGYGGADKAQIQAMVVRLLGLKEIPKPDDAADALAVAVCHAHSHKMRGLGHTHSRGHRD